MFGVVYYYPTRTGAPSEVGRNIFLGLLNKRLPFKIHLFTQYKKENKKLKEKYTDIDVLSLNDLFKLNGNQIVHFSVEPVIFPNRKFMLYLIAVLNKKIFRKTKLVINYHGDPKTEFEIRFKNKGYLTCFLLLPDYLLTPLVLRSANAIVVNSYSMEKFFKLRYKTSDIFVIPNALDNTWICESKIQNFEKKENSINLFFHGRLAPEKGVDLLIKAFSYIGNQRNFQIKLYLAGPQEDKKYANYLKELCLELGIDKDVTFLGSLPISVLKSYLNSVDAAIYPSVYEPFSLAILEAFSIVNGPVIYSCKSGINDFVLAEGYEFLTFEPSIEGIANSIKMLLEKSYDQNILHKQKEFAAMYTWDKIADKYIELYQKINVSEI
jgi:glycosyltransferase involved in cell wall biosynthesis